MKKWISIALGAILFTGTIMLPAQSDAKSHSSIEEQLKHMTLEEKVGQMMMGGFDGPQPNEDARRLIQEGHFGSIILFAYNDNVKDPVQTAQLTNGLQKIAEQTRLKIPLLIATDQEGGVVARLTTGATELPGNMALGATRDECLVYQSGEITAKELRAVGIQMNLAPDVDVNVNPDNPVIGVRSYAEKPELVAKMGQKAIEAMQKNRVIATAKHFPGHGDTNVDSHIGLPVIHKSVEELEKVELVPFKKAIESRVDAIMTAHISVPALDPTPDLPATLSKPILTGLLREKMGYQGIIITDSMTMAGVANYYGGVPKAVVRAVDAGADIILLTSSLTTDQQLEVHQAIVDAVRNGTLSEKRIDQSVRRILSVKEKYKLYKDRYVDVKKVPKKVGTKKHLKQAENMARKSITLVQNDGLLPLRLDASESLGIISHISLLDEAKKHHANVEEVVYSSLNPTNEQIEQAVEMAKDKDVLIVGTYSASLYPQQVKLVQELSKLNKPMVVIGLRNPYDLKEFPDVSAYMNTYGFRSVSLKAAMEVVFGVSKPEGKLPVTIPGLYEYGHGLTYPTNKK